MKTPVIVTEDLAIVGQRVVRGKHWIWDDQDEGCVGTIINTNNFEGWVKVKWDWQSKEDDINSCYSYRVNSLHQDLYLAPEELIDGYEEEEI